jgi:polyisoprenoid-binding protein YceI
MIIAYSSPVGWPSKGWLRRAASDAAISRALRYANPNEETQMLKAHAKPRRYPGSSVLILTTLPVLASADTFVVDERHTFPSFEISHIGFSTQRGRFNHTTGKIALDEQKKTGSIHISIDANSIDTGLGELEERLKKDDIFNVAKYPAITFDSDHVAFENGKPVKAEGVLQLLGTKKPVQLDIQRFLCGIHPINKKNVCGADAKATIKRSEFGMTALTPAIGDEVAIQIQIEAFRE